ncbi:hypothetical protein BDZ88DRAFT_454726 [Geranomyces variabilis]|nr:hypothetical protein BDZ88DRAFT_454726 [Geranomyces variabilis]KAJ3136078.1 hypothetical protein HDU90_003481 [Geranomyces variabilis]
MAAASAELSGNGTLLADNIAQHWSENSAGDPSSPARQTQVPQALGHITAEQRLSARAPLHDARFGLEAMLRECRNDMSLYMLYRSLQAPYGYLKHCKDVLESCLGQHFDNFFLMPRGSITTGTALKSTADLDIDLVLPRIVPQLRPEAVNNIVDARPLSLSEPKARAAAFQRVLEDICATITRGKHLRLRPMASLTRSLPLVLVIDGREEELDLFVKLTTKDGRLASMNKKDQEGGRDWKYDTYSFERNAHPDLQPAQECAILLVKHWKAHDERLEKAEKLWAVWDYPKGYHVNLAMERLREENAAERTKQATEGELKRKPKLERSKSDGGTPAEKAGAADKDPLIAYLIDAYTTTNSEKSRFKFQLSTEKGNPFITDTEDLKLGESENTEGARQAIRENLRALQAVVERWNLKREGSVKSEGRVNGTPSGEHR